MKNLLEQGTTICQPKNVAQIVSSILLYPSYLNEWFNFDVKIRNSKSISIFEKRLLSFIWPVQSHIYNIFDPQGLKVLTSLCLGLSHINKHVVCIFISLYFLRT